MTTISSTNAPGTTRIPERILPPNFIKRVKEVYPGNPGMTYAISEGYYYLLGAYLRDGLAESGAAGQRLLTWWSNLTVRES
jgi:hypothetical protein